jgi:ABC-type uncharacterized transport system YnjBCD ATPase subunit
VGLGDGLDDEFKARAERRRVTAWTRVVRLAEADDDDPDDVASTASERVALVDTLMSTARWDATNGATEQRLQRSVAHVIKRRR